MGIPQTQKKHTFPKNLNIGKFKQKRQVMEIVQTKLDSATIEKINRSGMTKYQFLKEAVELKLKNDEALSVEATVEDLIEKKFKQLEQRSKQINQDLVEQSFGAVLEVFHDVKKDLAAYEKKISVYEIKHDQFRDGLRKTVENLFDAIAKK